MIITINGVTYGEKEAQEEARKTEKHFLALRERLKALPPLRITIAGVNHARPE